MPQGCSHLLVTSQPSRIASSGIAPPPANISITFRWMPIVCHQDHLSSDSQFIEPASLLIFFVPITRDHFHPPTVSTRQSDHKDIHAVCQAAVIQRAVCIPPSLASGASAGSGSSVAIVTARHAARGRRAGHIMQAWIYGLRGVTRFLVL